MSDALPLPARPNLEQYKKLAKDFQHACKSGQTDAVREWAARWAEALAKLHGRDISAELRPRINVEAERIEHRWREFGKKNPDAARCRLADAQFFIARAHGFASWPKFAAHVEALARRGSPVWNFEAAADAIVGGDSATLARLLQQHPDLVRARSTREHRSTLLHYVSANGVEDFRQKTPKNIVAITKLLLNAGADVNAESDAYAGRSTTLGLTATSCHPEDAGVQLALMQLLVDRGAIIDGPDAGSAVNACLHNGRGPAAAFLASHGARLDLEGAAGVGRLDVVRSFFNENGTLRAAATAQQMKDGFAWACEFGRTSVVEFLLRRGVEVNAKLRHDGETGLHWAAYGGHADTVRLLLQHGAPVDVKDKTYDGTPLGWALYAWGTSPARAERGRYYEVVALLVQAGATVDPQWYEANEDRQRAAGRMRSDARMLAALRGQMPAE